MYEIHVKVEKRAYSPDFTVNTPQNQKTHHLKASKNSLSVRQKRQTQNLWFTSFHNLSEKSISVFSTKRLLSKSHFNFQIKQVFQLFFLQLLKYHPSFLRHLMTQHGISHLQNTHLLRHRIFHAK